MLPAARAWCRQGRLSVWGCLALLSACTGTDVDAIRPYRNDKLALEGDFCTTSPAEVMYTTRVLFLIDCSDSMRWNDPTGARADAIGEFIEGYREEEEVLFGIIRFGSSAEVETEAFTKDEAELDAALLRIQDPNDPRQYLGGTDYITVLSAALNFIVRDRITNAQNRETRYIVVFLTDGAPQANDMDPALTVQRILEQVRALRTMEVVLHSLMMSAEMMGVPPEFLTILQAMAAEGGGEYRELAGPGTVGATLGELLKLKAVLRVFDLREFFAVNFNTVVAELGGRVAQFVDSDGDGLAEFQEEALGTSPVLWDSDEDFLGDLVELRVGLDPLAREQHNLGPEWFTDPDGDGLNNLEERLTATDPLRFDTDLDRIPDGLEIRAGTDPLLEDERGDYDQDFIPNLDEIRAHTNPRLHEGGLQEELGYRYRVEPTGRNGGRFCYRFLVENITLRTPQAIPGGEEGQNRLQLVEVDTPEDNPGVMENQRRSDLEIIYRGPAYRTPNALKLFLEDEDFE